MRFLTCLMFVLGLGLVVAGCNDKDRDNTVYSTNNTTPTTNPVRIDAQTLPNGTVGQLYSYRFTATGGTGPFAWTISQGALPSGVDLVLPELGEIQGVPTATGHYQFSIRVTDANGNVSSFTTAIDVN